MQVNAGPRDKELWSKRLKEVCPGHVSVAGECQRVVLLILTDPVISRVAVVARLSVSGSVIDAGVAGTHQVHSDQ